MKSNILYMLKNLNEKKNQNSFLLNIEIKNIIAKFTPNLHFKF